MTKSNPPNRIDILREIAGTKAAEEIDGYMIDHETATAYLTVHDGLSEVHRIQLNEMAIETAGAVAHKLLAKFGSTGE